MACSITTFRVLINGALAKMPSLTTLYETVQECVEALYFLSSKSG